MNMSEEETAKTGPQLDAETEPHHMATGDLSLSFEQEEWKKVQPKFEDLNISAIANVPQNNENECSMSFANNKPNQKLITEKAPPSFENWQEKLRSLSQTPSRTLETGEQFLDCAKDAHYFAQYEKHKYCLVRAREIFEEKYGSDHLETGKILYRLGVAYGKVYHEKERQKDVFSRVLEIFKKKYGDNHLETGQVLKDLGNALGSEGEYQKQVEYLTQAQNIFEKHYGKDHIESRRLNFQLKTAKNNLDEKNLKQKTNL